MLHAHNLRLENLQTAISYHFRVRYARLHSPLTQGLISSIWRPSPTSQHTVKLKQPKAQINYPRGANAIRSRFRDKKDTAVSLHDAPTRNDDPVTRMSRNQGHTIYSTTLVVLRADKSSQLHKFTAGTAQLWLTSTMLAPNRHEGTHN